MKPIRFFLLLALALPLWAGETVLSHPKPTLEHPRQLVIEINSGDEKTVSGAIAAVNNLIKAYQPGFVEIAVVIYGPALPYAKKNSGELSQRMETLIMMDVALIACRNTMETYRLSQEQLIDGMDTVQAGLQEIAERKLAGWIHLKP